MRLGPFLALAGLFFQSAAMAQTPPPDSVAGFRVLDVLDPCRAAQAAGEIRVCGRRDSSRYRLPDLGSGRAGAGTSYVRGEVPRASADPTASGPCGIFQGQRSCSKAEMAEFGYGEGRNPVAFLGNVVTRLADPEAEIGAPPPGPE